MGTDSGDEIFGDDEDEPDEVESEHSVRLDDLLDAVGDNLVYRYDFGDDWEHLVLLESIEPLPKGKRAPRPRCVDGRRACPPEDCGGPGGYARMLQALRDPSDPEHETYAEWLGEEFDPDAF